MKTNPKVSSPSRELPDQGPQIPIRSQEWTSISNLRYYTPESDPVKIKEDEPSPEFERMVRKLYPCKDDDQSEDAE